MREVKAKKPRPRREWTPTMESRAADEEGRQVKCLIASEGHLWMRGWYDRLRPVVRKRLAQSPFNICAACMMIEAGGGANASDASVAAYITTIEAIEKKLRGGSA